MSFCLIDGVGGSNPHADGAGLRLHHHFIEGAKTSEAVLAIKFHRHRVLRCDFKICPTHPNGLEPTWYQEALGEIKDWASNFIKDYIKGKVKEMSHGLGDAVD